jgi:hypothetical protein
MKKRNYIGAAECRIWMRETFVGKDVSDLSREDLKASDADIAKRFNLNQVTVSNIRRELGVCNARDRMYIANNLRPKGVEVAPEQEPEKHARPAWINACKWVVLRDGDCRADFNTIGRISSINEERGMFWVDWGDKASNREGFTFEFGEENFYPIRFREYTFDDAELLLGKRLEIVGHNYRRVSIISTVVFNSGGVQVDGQTLGIFAKKMRVATVDGLPFGVPEIDKDALDACSPES